MPSRLGHGLYKKIDRLKNIFRCIYIIIEYSHANPNNYSQPMHNIIVVHNYIVVTLYILVLYGRCAHCYVLLSITSG